MCVIVKHNDLANSYNAGCAIKTGLNCLLIKWLESVLRMYHFKGSRSTNNVFSTF